MEFKFGGKYRLEEEIANGGCGQYSPFSRAASITQATKTR